MNVGSLQNSTFIHSQGSPFAVLVYPSLPDATLSVAYGTSLTNGRAGLTSTFTVQSKDSFGNKYFSSRLLD